MSNYKLIDSHVNFGHELLANKSKEIIKESVENEIIGMLCVNSNLSEFSKDLSIVIDYETIDITIGQHPNYVDEMPINDMKTILGSNLKDNSKIVAVGETGLDFHYNANKTKQIESLEAHFEMASQYDKAVLIHMRDSEDEIFPILDRYRSRVPQILIHCFTGSDEFANKCMDLDCYYSISGIITFKNAEKLRNTIKKLPIDRIIFETDSPYLTPDPHRGKTNYPKYLKLILEKYCEIMAINTKEMATRSNDNYNKLFSKNN
ncbi:TatD family hydrolase [Alphaproteobacteria bacterium]|nr:TatD family hydrolase [Alphaproteobacteria bacterium]